MPGPSNVKRGKKKIGTTHGSKKPAAVKNRVSSHPTSQTQVTSAPPPPPTKTTKTTSSSTTTIQKSITAERNEESSSSSSPPSPLLTPPPLVLWGQELIDVRYEGKPIPEIDSARIEEIMVKPPFIHDPGNGPRVRDTRAFLKSRFFAQPPAWDIPMCAEFAQEEVLQMLMTVLPGETARTLWYNKSRATSRICPACQRLYRLGDILPDHMSDIGGGRKDPHSRHNQHPPPYLYREQEISGLCSPVCFILASFAFPSAIKSIWGRLSPEISDEAWTSLNDPILAPLKPLKSDRGSGRDKTVCSPEKGPNGQSQALGMLVRMTRLDDLGLAQLCFGPEDEAELEELEDAYGGINIEQEKSKGLVVSS